jgi:hypothetical protein
MRYQVPSQWCTRNLLPSRILVFFCFIQVEEGMRSHLFLLSLLGTVYSSPIFEDDRGEYPYSGCPYKMSGDERSVDERSLPRRKVRRRKVRRRKVRRRKVLDTKGPAAKGPATKHPAGLFWYKTSEIYSIIK